MVWILVFLSLHLENKKICHCLLLINIDDLHPIVTWDAALWCDRTILHRVAQQPFLVSLQLECILVLFSSCKSYFSKKKKYCLKFSILGWSSFSPSLINFCVMFETWQTDTFRVSLIQTDSHTLTSEWHTDYIDCNPM